MAGGAVFSFKFCYMCLKVSVSRVDIRTAILGQKNNLPNGRCTQRVVLHEKLSDFTAL